MTQLPTIHLIHAKDAPDSLGRLKEILNNLKAEHRINKHVSIDAESSISLSGQVQEEDMILLVLSKALESQKENIEKELQKLKQQHPGLKVAEIILDNIPYENEFITFPADLKPIRNREDTEVVWDSIAQSLRDIFPVQEEEVNHTPTPTSSPSQSSKYVKWGGIIAALFFMAFFLIWFFVDFGPDRVREAEPVEVREEATPSTNEAAAEEEAATQQDCYVTTGMMSQCHVEPDPFSTTRGTFPSNKRYDVLDTRVYEHGDLTEVYFFRIRDRGEGLEGWVPGRSLDYFSDACINN